METITISLFHTKGKSYIKKSQLTPGIFYLSITEALKATALFILKIMYNKAKQNLKTMKKIALISGSTHLALAQKISFDLNVRLTEVSIEKFSCDEINVEIKETVRGAEVFIIQSSLTGHGNDNFVEAMLIIDAAKRAGASKVYLVQTIFPYQRQDRRETNRRNRPKRKAISGRVMADCFARAVFVDGIISIKLHSDQIEGFFDNRTLIENIDPTSLFIEYLKSENIIRSEYGDSKPPTVVAPDIGSAKTADSFSEALGLNDYVIVNKRRTKSNESEVLHVIGDYSGRICIIYDDMIDTGGTVVNSQKKLQELKEAGATDVYLMAPHGIFSKNAIERLSNSDFKKIVITDSIPNPQVENNEKFVILSLAPLLKSVIKNIHDAESLQPVVANKS